MRKLLLVPNNLIPTTAASKIDPSCPRPLWTVLAGLALVVVLGALPAFAGTITVSNTSDSGSGSLRQAIADANSAGGDTINFSVTGTITLTSGELFVGKDLTISGPGASILAISGNFPIGGDPIFTSTPRVFAIDSGTTVAISGLTIQNGTANYGGGIHNGGTLTLAHSIVSGNYASGFFGQGGGIYNSGTLTVTNSTLSGNSPAYYGDGGGIVNDYSGILTLTNSTLSGNTAHVGAGLVNRATATVTNSTFSGNGANYSGGIHNTGMLTVTNSTLSGNTAPFGGGIGNYGTLIVSNSTLSGNDGERGGAFYNIGTVTVKNTIVARSNSYFGGNCGIGSGTFTSQGHNLSDDGTCPFTQPSDLNNTFAGLGTLQNNGGPTETIALLPASPAVDAILVSDCTDVNLTAVTTDQRGILRPQGQACDIGAVEFALSVAPGQIVSLGAATVWVGLKNSDDQGTQFDLRVELYKNNSLVSAGETSCVTGVTRNPSSAREVALAFGPIAPSILASGDILSLKVLTRIGTNPNGSKCSGPGGSHANAVGLRLYYDATGRPSRFNAEISPDPASDIFLHSGVTDFLNSTTPNFTSPATKDSPAVNFASGNPWKTIGTWSQTIP
jgi:hypothetical protein